MIQKPFINKITKNFGIGQQKAITILKNSGLNTRNNPIVFKIKHCNEIEKSITDLKVGKKLQNTTKEIIDFLSKTKTYKGIRHKLKYPVRGQRTHTNAKTKQKIKF